MQPSTPSNSSIFTIQSILRSTEKELASSGIDDAKRSCEVLLGFVLNKKDVELIRDMHEIVQANQVERFFALVEKRKNRMPIAYLVNQKEFYSMPFYVDEHVLIPRPETELLVEKAIEIISSYRQPSPVVCDVGTGSGIISVAIKKNCPMVKMIGIDISAKAIQVAKTNANRNAVDIVFMQGDLLESIHVPIDIVLANLPYIPTEDIPFLESGVKDFEPYSALDGGRSGLFLIEKLLNQAREKLKHKGYVLLEFGMGQEEDLKEMVMESAFELVCLLDDIAGIPRVLVARKV